MASASLSGTYPTAPALVLYPDPVLRQRCAPVTAFDADLRAFCSGMFAVMAAERGVGLAAPQVGVARRIFVTNHVREGDPEQRIWINPRLENRAGETSYEEGCLSIPGVYGKVVRANALDIVWQDLDGREQRQHLDVGAGDFLGIVVQHEADHLDGKLHIDHIDLATLSLHRRKLRELEKEYKARTGKPGAVLRR
jgi:peptide deformylase